MRESIPETGRHVISSLWEAPFANCEYVKMGGKLCKGDEPILTLDLNCCNGNNITTIDVVDGDSEDIELEEKQKPCIICCCAPSDT